MELQKGYVIDGKVFSTKAEAEEYMRGPKINAALVELTGDQQSADWIQEKSEFIIEAYKSGSVRRVTKADRKALTEALAEIDEGFLFVNKDAIIDSFRWPSVARDANPAEIIKANFMELCEDQEDLADWLIANKAGVLEAFDAGKVKRQPSQAAMDALAKHREKKAAEKAAKEAAEAAVEA